MNKHKFQMKGLLFISIILLSVPNVQASPSFNCNQANNKSEKFICNNLLISDLDNLMFSTYQDVLKKKDHHKREIHSSQREWLKKRNNCQHNYLGKSSFSSCIKYIYNTRIHELETMIQKSTKKTKSRKFYEKGNKEYQDGKGNYYMSIKHYSNAYIYSNNYVDKVRALGAMSEISKQQGNLLLAKKYAQQILTIDPTNDFAKNIIDFYKSKQRKKEKNIQRYEYQHPSKHNIHQDECQIKCLIQVFGTEVCASGIEEFAKSEFDTRTYNFVTSTACEITITKMLNKEPDIQTAVVTGVLDDVSKAGWESDNSFEKILGIFAKGASLAIKYNSYHECQQKCDLISK